MLPFRYICAGCCVLFAVTQVLSLCPQALIVSPEVARRYETLSVDPGSAIAADLRVADEGEFVYILSAQKVRRHSHTAPTTGSP